MVRGRKRGKFPPFHLFDDAKRRKDQVMGLSFFIFSCPTLMLLLSLKKKVSFMPNGVSFQAKTIQAKHSCKSLLDDPAVKYSWITRKLSDTARAKPNILVKRMSEVQLA